MNRLESLFWRGAVWARRLVAKHPFPYFALIRWVKPRTFPWQAVSRRTELVIEGYPGSGNTLTTVAFTLAQGRAVDVAHHCHAPAQVLRAVRWQLPSVVLLRDPDDAISSNLARWKHLTMREALLDYVAFYAPLWSHRAGFLVMSFPEVVNDIGSVVPRINRRFHTSFLPISTSDADVAACRAVMTDPNGPWGRHWPSDERQQAKARIIEQLRAPHFSALRAKCYEWYEQFSALATA